MCQISDFATAYITTKEEPRSHGEKGKEWETEANLSGEWRPIPAWCSQVLEWQRPCSGSLFILLYVNVREYPYPTWTVCFSVGFLPHRAAWMLLVPNQVYNAESCTGNAVLSGGPAGKSCFVLFSYLECLVAHLLTQPTWRDFCQPTEKSTDSLAPRD